MATTVDDVTANEIRSQGLQAHSQIMNEMLNTANFFTNVLKATSMKTLSELDAVESAANERLLNAPPRP